MGSHSEWMPRTLRPSHLSETPDIFQRRLMTRDELCVSPGATVHVPTGSMAEGHSAGVSIATRDPAVIRAWAARHHAEPATGEATFSGPATISVNDGSVGIRFNFPGAGRFRPIDWEEWLEHLERHQLVFVYEEEVADRAYALWRARGGHHNGDRDDWFEAERQLRRLPRGASPRYWIVKLGDSDRRTPP
jgi:hypothetical protein